MKVRKLCLMLLLTIIVFSIGIHAYQAEIPHIGEDDTYEKEAEIDSQVSFRWTISRYGHKNHSVRVEVCEDLEEWLEYISPSHFVLHEDNKYESVQVIFEIPRFPDKEISEGSVRFTFRELDKDEHIVEEREISIKVVGVTPTPERNTILGGYPNPLPEPLDHPYGAFVLNIGIWLAIAFVASQTLNFIIHFLSRKTKGDMDEIIIRMLSKPLFILIFLYGIIDSLIRLQIDHELRTGIYQIYMLIVAIVGLLVAYKIIMGILEHIGRQRTDEEDSFRSVLMPVLKKMMALIIIVSGLIIIFRILNIEVTAILAGAGVAGLVIAFAAQDTLSNFFSGMHLLLDQPFKVGDIILLESGEYCVVEEIGMRSTKLYALREHEGIILPNNNLANQKIINIAKPDSTIRSRIEVGVAYGSDIDKVKNILFKVAEEHPNVVEHEERQTAIRFSNFGDSSLDFALIVWIDDVTQQWKVMSEIRQKIDKRFREEGITIPFPQRTVWFHDMKE